MKTSAEPIENSQVALNVEMEADEVDNYMSKAYSRLVHKVSIPGFRKGKAPRDVLERHIGRDALFQEALDQLIPEAYEEALQEQKIAAIDRPKIELIKTDPVTFKATVPVRPTVKLGDYKQIRIESKPVEISQSQVDLAIDQIRHQHAVLTPVERPVQFGDTVIIDVKSISQGESSPMGKDLVYEVTKEARLPLPGFAEKLEGMNKDEEKSFTLNYPAEYEIKDLADKEYSFEVTVKEVKEKTLPEVDDEFAKGLGGQDLASMQEEIANNLKNRAEDMARMELEQKAIDAAIELSELDYPPILVDREIDRLLNDEARHFSDGVEGLENYLKATNNKLEAHVQEF